MGLYVAMLARANHWWACSTAHQS